MPKKVNEELQQSFNKGLKIIINAFNEQTKEYSKTIYEQEIEIKRLTEENIIYKNKLTLLHKKLCLMSKTFCDINIDKDNEEEKIQSEENQSINKEIMSANLNNMYQQKFKKDSFINHKENLEHNLKYSSFQEKPKSSRIKSKIQKKNSSNHYNLKYLLNNNNRDYNRLLRNLHYLKKKSINIENKDDELKNSNNNNNSYFVGARKENEKILENFKTDREMINKKKLFSEKYLEENETNIEIPDLFNNNTISFNNKNNANKMNNNEISNNINSDSELKSKNESDIEPKNNRKYEDNLNSKVSFEEESKGQSIDSTYQKLHLFLDKCKVKLNALDYEKIINVLKYYENNSNIDIIKKIKKIINCNNKLCELFDDIFETS
jgi:hypothetical protein